MWLSYTLYFGIVLILFNFIYFLHLFLLSPLLFYFSHPDSSLKWPKYITQYVVYYVFLDAYRLHINIRDVALFVL